MKLYTLITIYHHDKTNPMNPLVKVHLSTTDDKLAKANYERMVAHEVHKGMAPTKKSAGYQVDLEDDTSSMTIALNLTTENMEFTFGRSQW